MDGADDAPLILTLRFDSTGFARFDALRRQHFPAQRNLIPAHLTLFHHLPGRELPGVAAVLAELGRLQRPFTLEAQGLRFLGRGVAYNLASPDLLRLRAELARTWHGWLTPQDRQKFQPHVTVQNKVTADAARGLMERLGAGFSAFVVAAEGLDLWRYRGGPWEPAGEFLFTG